MRMEIKDDCASGAEAKERMLAAHRRRQELMRPVRAAVVIVPELPAPEITQPRKLILADPIFRSTPQDLMPLQILPAAVPMPVLPTSVQPLDPPLTVRCIMYATAEHFGITEGQLTSGRRTYDLVRCRHIGIYICRKRSEKSYPRIAAYFEGRDHTTILHSYRKIDALVQSGDVSILMDIEAIERRAEYLAATGFVVPPIYERPRFPAGSAGQTPLPTILRVVCDHFRISLRKLISLQNRYGFHWRGIAAFVAVVDAGVPLKLVSYGLGRGEHQVAKSANRARCLINEGDTQVTKDIAAIRLLLNSALPEWRL